MGENVKKIFLLAIVLFSIGVAYPVAAHSDLVSAVPSPGAQLAESPAEIRLTFSEPVAASSRIELFMDDFQRVDGLVSQFNPAQPEQIYTPLPVLEPGVYTVQWAAASTDGHEISGSYSFSVGLVAQDATGAATTGELVAAEPTTAQPAGSRSSWWLAALGLLAVGLPLALFALRRTGRR